MTTYEQILARLGDTERAELDKFIFALSDDLSKNILRKLASPHSPISSDELPSRELGGSKVASLRWLDMLEDMSFVRSELVKKGERYCRVYDITNKGREVVQKYNIFM